MKVCRLDRDPVAEIYGLVIIGKGTLYIHNACYTGAIGMNDKFVGVLLGEQEHRTLLMFPLHLEFSLEFAVKVEEGAE
jgi:hypothetical protein